MEKKIGEIFEYGGEWYQCMKGNTCNDCAFYRSSCGSFNGKGSCRYNFREDATNVIFKKLEKIGEPITVKGRTFQKLILDNYSCANCVFNAQNKECYKNSYIDGLCSDNGIWVEIKQNKEDMEEREYSEEEFKNNPRFQHHKPIEQVINMKKVKPFDLQKAKAGKPVCTRDGSNARIICFDRNDIKPIVALVTIVNGTSVIEKAFYYFEDGHHLSKNDNNIYDLMMLSEKKEGWINIYNADTTFYYVDGRVFETKDEAVKEAKEEVEKEQREKNEYIDTIRVEWEE